MPSFIADDEYIILFDVRDKWMSREDYIACASGGVATALTNVDWFFIEQTPGRYDWSETDGFVDKCVHSGIKGLLLTPNVVAACMPDDWYSWSESGVPQRHAPMYSIFSPWHAEAQAYQDAFVQMVIDRYQSAPVQVIRGGAHGGESLLPYDPCYFEPAALESFRVWASDKFYGNISIFNKEEGVSFQGWEQIKPSTFEFARVGHRPITKLWLREHLIEMVVRQQMQLVRHYGGEAWFMLAHCWTDVMQTGNFLIPEISQIIRERVQPTQVNWIAFAHFNLSSTLMHMALKRTKEEGVKLWTGSQYCEGLAVNTDTAIEKGIRGFITGPLSIEDGHSQSKVEPWMVENIRNSLAEWKAHSELSRSV
jgi:hypothetical protein